MNFFKRASVLGFILPKVTPEKILRGVQLADLLLQQCLAIGAHKNIVPKLVVVLAGDNPASQVYVRNKERAMHKAGILSETIRISDSDSTVEVLSKVILDLNQRTDVHGILLQLPLPNNIPAQQIMSLIDPNKDVDGFLAQNIGAVCLGQSSGVSACTPLGIMLLLYANGFEFAGKHAVVVGRSNIVGKPMAMLLLNEDCTVTIAHSKTKNLKEICLNADLIVAAAGQPHLIDESFVKPGCTLIDVGIHRAADGTLCGDIHPSAYANAIAYSPVPGGVGPMTIAMLAINTSTQAWR